MQPKTLSNLYDSFSPFGAALSNIAVNVGPPLNAVSFVVTLGGTTVTLSLDRYSVEAFVTGPSDDDVTKLMTLADQAHAVFVHAQGAPVQSRSANVQAALWYAAPSMADALAWLEQRDTQLSPSLATALNADQIDRMPRLRFRSNAQLWSANFQAEQSTVPPFQLFVNYNGVYLDIGHFKTPADRRQHISTLFDTVYGEWGLELVESLGP